MHDLPEANSTTVRNLYCLRAACPCLSWSTVAMRALTSFHGLHSDATLCSSPSPMQQWAGHIACTKLPEDLYRLFAHGLHEIFKCDHLKFTVCGHKQASKQTYIHTTSVNAVTLVWGSLRLAPMNV